MTVVLYIVVCQLKQNSEEIFLDVATFSEETLLQSQ